MEKALFTNVRNDYGTPQKLFDYLNNIFKFNLDACADKNNYKCKKYYSIEDDTFNHNWVGNVFINPPYTKKALGGGRTQRDFICKAYNDSLKFNSTCVVLIPARTDTLSFHNYIFNKAYKIIFVKGRLKFELNRKETDSATFPSMIVIYKNTKKNGCKTLFETLDINDI